MIEMQCPHHDSGHQRELIVIHSQLPLAGSVDVIEHGELSTSFRIDPAEKSPVQYRIGRHAIVWNVAGIQRGLIIDPNCQTVPRTSNIRE